jgi:UDP-galactopyranose mutase
MKNYDYILVGAGLFNAVFAHQARMHGKRCLVVERRSHVGGNLYCKDIEGITVHMYGPHIFHTSNKDIWNYVNSLVPFNNFSLNTIAKYKGKVFNLPFNMYTFYQMWGVSTPKEAQAIISQQTLSAPRNPRNLEEQAIALVGKDIYDALIKGYTEKQWGRKCADLPTFIIKRLPLRFTYNNNYFNDYYQGIPAGGYTLLIKELLKGTECRTSCDYLRNKSADNACAQKIVYTGAIDEFFEYRLGHLDYRSLRFENEVIETCNYQGNAIVNYTDVDIPYTRIVEHKWFDVRNLKAINTPCSVITREYPQTYKSGLEAYYPINNENNSDLYNRYISLAKGTAPNVIFAGRLGFYKYLDMDKTIEEALALSRAEFK